MNEYRYILEPYKGMKTRHTCPACKQQKSFVRYIDSETGNFLSREVGRCNRENNCGYHYTPKEYLKDHNINIDMKTIVKPHRIEPIKKTSYIPPELFKQSLRGYDKNNFIDYLISIFGKSTTSELVSRYFIGTSKHWEGATVFWQIDITGKVRTGKIMLYNSDTGKRIKEPFSHISWVHSAMKIPDYNLKQCFFGEHLLNDSQKPVAIVESEKTAIIASVYLPDFIWLAAGSSTNLKEEKFKVLQDRTVILYPDMNCFEKWQEKAEQLSQIATVTVSALLESSASDEEKTTGFDLADYLVNFDAKQIHKDTEPRTTEQQEPELQFQTVGDFFDLLKARGYKKLPSNFLGANAGIWQTQIN